MGAVTFSDAVRFAQELIRLPSPPGGESDVARRVLEEMERLDYDEADIDEVGNVIGVLRGGHRGPSVMLSSHLDIVDVGDTASWEYAPFDGIIADGFLHGRGAMDIKGPLALQTYAAAVARDRGTGGDIIVAHTVLEERGGWGMAHLMSSGRVRPDAVILGEATNGDICIGHRGRAELIVEIEGVAGHASAPERTRSPLTALPSLIPALREFGAALGEAPVLGRATAAITAVETLPRSRNVVPDRVRLVVDWRVLPDTTADGAIEQLEAFLREHLELGDATGWSVRSATEVQQTWTGRTETRRLFTPGFLLDVSHPVARAAADSIEQTRGARPAVRAWTFATDGGHTCGVHGVPTIGFAPGEERHAHTNRERLALHEAEAAFDAYPALIEAVRDVVAAGDVNGGPG